MKLINDMTKDELLSFISHYCPEISVLDDVATCVVCEDTENKDEYYYCCDKCSGLVDGD